MSRAAPPLVAAAALALAAAACGSGQARPAFPRDQVNLVLAEVDGGQVIFPNLRGRLVVVHFFATWSLAAMADVEELRALEKAFPYVEVVGIGLDPDGAKLLSPWRSAVDADWWVVLPDAEVTGGTTPFGKVAAVPTTFVLDRTGRIVWAKANQLAPGEIMRVVRSLEDEGPGP
jgi:peroxiredoxin